MVRGARVDRTPVLFAVHHLAKFGSVYFHLGDAVDDWGMPVL